MNKAILVFIIVLIISINGYSQDIILKTDSVKIEAKVIEVGINTVKYKKFSNQDGPVYLIKKTDIKEIAYQNGERDVFNNTEIPSEAPVFKENKALLNSLAAKGNTVYIDQRDKNAAIHTKKKLNNLGYWKITDDKNSADFILSFAIEYEWDSSNGIALFINPKTNEIFYKTERYFVTVKDDFNLKRGIIQKIINEDIVPLMIK